ncbi:MAG TPA: hypothetical protein VMU66_04945 [Gaiellales bacterium]|nr:hypothetical protein [Gaiellales bacterium]
MSSATVPGKTYDVVAGESGMHCPCEAGRAGRSCEHVRAVRAFQVEQERQASLALEQALLPGVAPAVKGQAEREPHRTKHGYALDEVASALQKTIRARDVDGAVWWSVELAESAPWYCLKRLLVTSCEDVGLADLEAVRTAHVVLLGWAQSRQHSYYVSPHAFALAAIVLARAPKSTEAEDALSLTLELMKRGERRPVPDYAVDTHTAAGRAAGKDNADWFDDRHLRFGIPVNAYTRRLAAVVPEWFSDELRAALAEADEPAS